MFENVCNAGGGSGDGLKSNGEGFVFGVGGWDVCQEMGLCGVVCVEVELGIIFRDGHGAD